jgi:Na+-driven multidrug efflux pump
LFKKKAFLKLKNYKRGAAFAVDISSFSMVLMCISYIYFKKIYVGCWNGWSVQCLYEWRVYLKLAIPAVLALLLEYSNFEVGTLCAGIDLFSTFPSLDRFILV